MSEDKVDFEPMQFMFGENDLDRAFLQQISLLPKTTVFISRKINTGNFENVDFSFTVQVPLGITAEQLERFNKLSDIALNQGLDIVTPLVNEQSQKIKAQIAAQAKK